MAGHDPAILLRAAVLSALSKSGRQRLVDQVAVTIYCIDVDRFDPDARSVPVTPLRVLMFGAALSMLAAGCANPELDRLQELADEARTNMINIFLNPDPVTGMQPFLPGEQVNCTTFWGGFGKHEFVSDAKSCVEARHFSAMEPVDTVAHDQRQKRELANYVTVLRNQEQAAEATRQAQRAQQAEATRRAAGSLGNAQAGLRAQQAGDQTNALRLFTEALDGGGLSQSDKELALVKRGQVYLALGNNDLARADLQQALQIDPSDREAAGLLGQ